MRWNKILMAVLLLWGTAVQAQSIQVGAGVVEDLDNELINIGQVAVISDPIQPLGGIQAHAGLLVAEEDTWYLHAGLNKVFELPGRWSWGLSLSAGYYDSNDRHMDLGHEVEFLTRLQLDYELSTDQSLRVELGHISNANIGDDNPGAEFVMFNWIKRL